MRMIVSMVMVAGLGLLPGAEGSPCARFVAPAAASAGEWIPVLAYRHRDSRGPLEVRLDGEPLAFRLLRYASPGVFLSVGVPVTAVSGRHDLQLYDPQKRIASIPLTVGP